MHDYCLILKVPVTTAADDLFMCPHLWGGEYIDFGVDPIFLVCTISCEPVVGFSLNFHGYINKT